MDTIVKFRISTRTKKALEQAAQSRGVTVSRIMRQAAELAQKGLLVDDQALADFVRVRELANAAIAALEGIAPAEAASKIRAAAAGIHDVAARNLRTGL